MESIVVNCLVRDRQVVVPCQKGNQTISWLASAAVAVAGTPAFPPATVCRAEPATARRGDGAEEPSGDGRNPGALDGWENLGFAASVHELEPAESGGTVLGPALPVTASVIDSLTGPDFRVRILLAGEDEGAAKQKGGKFVEAGYEDRLPGLIGAPLAASHGPVVTASDAAHKVWAEREERVERRRPASARSARGGAMAAAASAAAQAPAGGEQEGKRGDGDGDDDDGDDEDGDDEEGGQGGGGEVEDDEDAKPAHRHLSYLADGEVSDGASDSDDSLSTSASDTGRNSTPLAATPAGADDTEGLALLTAALHQAGVLSRSLGTEALKEPLKAAEVDTSALMAAVRDGTLAGGGGTAAQEAALVALLKALSTADEAGSCGEAPPPRTPGDARAEVERAARLVRSLSRNVMSTRGAHLAGYSPELAPSLQFSVGLAARGGALSPERLRPGLGQSQARAAACCDSLRRWQVCGLPLVPDEPGIRRNLYHIFTDPSSAFGTLVYWTVLLCIVASIVVFCVESAPEYRVRELHGETIRSFALIEVVSVAVFTVEYVARLVSVPAVPRDAADELSELGEWRTCHDVPPAPVTLAESGTDDSKYETPSRFGCWPELKALCCFWSVPRNGCCATWRVRRRLWGYLRDPMNLIDLAAILPFYISLGVNQGGTGALSVLRVLRLGRVLRIFKLGRRSAGMQVIGVSLYRSIDALAMTVFWIAILVVLFGALIFFFESGTYDEGTGLWMRPDKTGSELEESPFRSIMASFWWVITTATTVGYGDLYPTSTGGKIVATLVMLSGVLILALPITIVGSNFNQAYTKLTQKERRHKRRQRSRRRQHSHEAGATSPAPAAPRRLTPPPPPRTQLSSPNHIRRRSAFGGKRASFADEATGLELASPAQELASLDLGSDGSPSDPTASATVPRLSRQSTGRPWQRPHLQLDGSAVPPSGQGEPSERGE